MKKGLFFLLCILQLSTFAQRDYPAVSTARFQLITGMNHILKQASADRQENFATYTKPELPLAPGLLEAIRGFIK